MLAYTNAATILTDQYRDTEELGGIFTGFNPEKRSYEDTHAAWQYAGHEQSGAKT